MLSATSYYYDSEVIVNRKSHISEIKGVITISIKSQRLKLGLSQAELAERVGVDQTAVSQWENGIGPKRSRLAEVAKALECSVEDLLNEDEQ